MRLEGGNHDVMLYYQLHGLLNDRLRISWPYKDSVFRREGLTGDQVPLDEADFVVLQYRQTGFRGELMGWLRGRKPVYQLSHRGIPLLEIYAQ